MTGIDPEIVKRATLAHVNASRGAHGLSPLNRLPWTDHCDSVYGYTRAALEAVLPDLIRQAKAEALQDAAESFGENQTIREGDVKEWLHARADAIARAVS